ALVGIGLFLTALAHYGGTCSEFRSQFPDYIMTKNKIQLNNGVNVDEILNSVKKEYSDTPTNTEDGVKLEFEEGWVHLRKSNTEPIIRLYAEGKNIETAHSLNNSVKQVVDNIKKK
ncbi:MAG: phosphoglucosamine mutase, partial [Flavobacteriales bacterium]